MMNYVFIGGIIQFLLLTNIAYAASLSYKESITNSSGIKKTSNGIFMAYFSGCATIGNLGYQAIRVFSSGGRKKQDKIWVGSLSAAMTVLMSLIAGTMQNGFIRSMPEDHSFLNTFGTTVRLTWISLTYFGYVFGLFGGLNVRLIDTPVSNMFISIKDKLDKYCEVQIIEGVKDAVEVAKSELIAAEHGESGTSVNIVKYLVAVVCKVVTSLCEELHGLSVVLVDVANFVGAATLALYLFVFRALWYFVNGMGSSEVADESVEQIISNPVNMLFDNLLNMFISIVIICIIKGIIKLVLMVLPAPVSEYWYELNNNLYVWSSNRLEAMTKKNYERDTYAQQCKLRQMMHRAEGNKE